MPPCATRLYERHMTKSAAYTRKWREANLGKVDDYKRSLRGKYAQLKRAAKRAGRELAITIDEYALTQIAGLCHYCGGCLSDYGYSLDRLDHLGGYTLKNVVACCGSKNGSRQASCNMRKGHLEAIGFKYPRTVELLHELLQEEK
jgi:hypothetical protein